MGKLNFGKVINCPPHKGAKLVSYGAKIQIQIYLTLPESKALNYSIILNHSVPHFLFNSHSKYSSSKDIYFLCILRAYFCK